MLPNEEQALDEANAKKPSRFSFKWLLRHTRDTKSSTLEKEDSSVKFQSSDSYTLLPKSKSCDPCMYGGLRSESSLIRKSPTVPVPFLHLQRKISAALAYSGFPSRVSSAIFCSSYSSNDIQNVLSPSQSSGSSSTARNNTHLKCSPEAELGPTSSCRSACSSHKDLCASSYLCSRASTSCSTPTPNPGHQLCKLCLMFVPPEDLYTLKKCSCIFCLLCIQQYLMINIREGNVILTCPDASCSSDNLIQVTEVEDLVEREIFDMFLRFKQCREVELDPTRTWCPGIDCETVCYVRPPPDPDKAVSIQCPKCRLKFCSLCKERWHSKRTCEDVRRERQEEEEVLLLEQEEEDAAKGRPSLFQRQQPSIKRCPNPNCRIPIERDEGCAQMMCKRCKHVFCWYCLTSLDDDLLLRHYDKGPCKNKLGHSRASVVWHRTQVVGVLAGFGFLLLIASPLLLIAAPCLLCCRCKQCTRFFDEEPTAV